MLRYLLIIIVTFAISAGTYYYFFTLDSSEIGRIDDTIMSAANNDFSSMNSVENMRNYVSPISINYLRSRKIDSEKVVLEEKLSNGSNYERYIASYDSDGYKIYGLLTIPLAEMPAGGYRAIIFNHGYIPPDTYVTTQRYDSYIDYLAKNGFVVFKIDMRGHGESEGNATGTYFSPAYTIDAISAARSLQKWEKVNPGKIGIWGHSMAGNLSLRALLVSDVFKASVIWAGAVYSYEDFAEYRISDSSYVRRRSIPEEETELEEEPGDEASELKDTQDQELQTQRETSEKVTELRESSIELDFSDPFWKSISLTQNLRYLTAPVQVHHAANDDVVNVNYSRDLVEAFEEQGKYIEYYEYQGGGHNIVSPYFETAMQRTVDFYNQNL